MTTATVTSKGQITIPSNVRQALQVEPGDTVTFTPRVGARPHRFRVSGIALVTAPDVLFQPLNPLLGPAPAQPPADIAIVPLANFASSSVHTVSGSGEETFVVRVTAVDIIASGPCTEGPCSAKRNSGGVFFTATSVNGLTT